MKARGSTRSVLKNGLIVTMDPARRVFRGDILVEDNRIKKIAKQIRLTPREAQQIDCTDKFVIPGLIQTHVHLCQVLFRGEADDLALLDWLQTKIWPMEVNHNARSIKAAAHIAILEMQLSGTTSILDMGTVSQTQNLLEAVEITHMRYWGGKCLMDARETSGPLYEPTRDSLIETEELIKEWAHRNELLKYVLCPRFAISCTKELLEACAGIQKAKNMLVHTHASESLDEIAMVRKMTGFDNLEYFDRLGLLNSKTVIVHGVHVSDSELDKMVAKKVPLVHCPSSNLKLGSGFAPIEKYINRGLIVGVGSDGAPCNNSMDPFKEIHLAALLQKPFFGPSAMTAEEALALGTINGAKILGAESSIGSLEEGKLADIVMVDRSHPSVNTVDNPYSALVYSCTGRDVTDVMINGKFVVRDRLSKWCDTEEVMRKAKAEKKLLIKRIG